MCVVDFIPFGFAHILSTVCICFFFRFNSLLLCGKLVCTNCELSFYFIQHHPKPNSIVEFLPFSMNSHISSFGKMKLLRCNLLGFVISMHMRLNHNLHLSILWLVDFANTRLYFTKSIYFRSYHSHYSIPKYAEPRLVLLCYGFVFTDGSISSSIPCFPYDITKD